MVHKAGVCVVYLTDLHATVAGTEMCALSYSWMDCVRVNWSSTGDRGAIGETRFEHHEIATTLEERDVRAD